MSDTECLADSSRLDPVARRVLEVLTQADLEGLQPGEPGWAPIDEYESEARSFAQLLDENGSINAADLRRVWMHWFSNDLPQLSPAEVERLVAALNGCAEPSAPVR